MTVFSIAYFSFFGEKKLKSKRIDGCMNKFSVLLDSIMSSKTFLIPVSPKEGMIQEINGHKYTCVQGRLYILTPPSEVVDVEGNKFIPSELAPSDRVYYAPVEKGRVDGFIVNGLGYNRVDSKNSGKPASSSSSAGNSKNKAAVKAEPDVSAQPIGSAPATGSFAAIASAVQSDVTKPADWSAVSKPAKKSNRVLWKDAPGNDDCKYGQKCVYIDCAKRHPQGGKQVVGCYETVNGTEVLVVPDATYARKPCDLNADCPKEGCGFSHPGKCRHFAL